MRMDGDEGQRGDDDAVAPHSHAPTSLTLPDPEMLASAARLFRALSDPGRLRSLLTLRDGEVCVSELAEVTREELPATSQRLRVLLRERLVRRRRDGRHVYYALDDHHVVELIENALEHVAEAPPTKETS